MLLLLQGMSIGYYAIIAIIRDDLIDKPEVVLQSQTPTVSDPFSYYEHLSDKTFLQNFITRSYLRTNFASRRSNSTEIPRITRVAGRVTALTTNRQYFTEERFPRQKVFVNLTSYTMTKHSKCQAFIVHIHFD